ncbi:MAG: YoaP domain-containing protein [Gracilimonas sp.]|nr:YoaP domain-containing protein [Gracilimonas sp.]
MRISTNDRDFFLQRGYLEHAHIPGFTMLLKKFKTEVPVPAFALPIAEKTNPLNPHGITISFADQSAFVNYYIHEMKVIFEDMGFDVVLHRVHTPEEARKSGSPYGTLGVFMDGHFLTHKLLNKNGIEELIGSLDLNEMYPEFKYLIAS